MSTICFTLLAIMAMSLGIATAGTVPPNLRGNHFGKSGKLGKVIDHISWKYRKCIPNVCFLLDGSGSLTPYQYQLQKEFVFTAAGLLDISNSNSKYSALQYGGTPAQVISGPTSDAELFQERILSSNSKRYDRTSITPSMLYCMSRFPGNGKSPHSPNKIVLLGDGRSNFGPLYGRFGPVAVGSMFRWRKNNDIVAVAVGYAAIPKLAAIAGGKDKVLSIDAWGVIKLLNLFEPLVAKICKGYY